MAIYALANPVYTQQMMVVLSITNATNALITTSVDGVNPSPHNYITGAIVRVDIPTGYGMQEINQLYAPITVISTTTFTIAIDSTLFSPFSFAPSWPYNQQFAVVVPIGEISSILTAAVINNLGPSF